MTEKTIQILETEYESLKEDAHLLSALRAAEVDNWDGWDYALEIFQERLKG